MKSKSESICIVHGLVIIEDTLLEYASSSASCYMMGQKRVFGKYRVFQQQIMKVYVPIIDAWCNCNDGNNTEHIDKTFAKVKYKRAL